MQHKIQLYTALLLMATATHGFATPPQSVPDVREVMPSIFKIHAVMYRHDYQQPWQAGGTTSGTGSAFLIGDGRLLTCGHVVADAISIEVQAHGSSQRHPAHVRYIGYDSDLAIIELDDPSVVANLPALELAPQMSELGDEVFAIGFPMGGTRLSLTRGIVSRLDHATYAFSGVDERLVMQIDAAINPGNSGGPVVNRENQIVGVAFQGITRGQGLGYAVPVPVIRHFITDTENAPYHGSPTLHLDTFELRNPTLRATLGLETPGTGVVVTEVSHLCTGAAFIQPGDILLKVEGIPIEQDGTVKMDNATFPFLEVVERKQWGDEVSFELIRDGQHQEVRFPLKPAPHPFVFRRIYDRPPEYLITGGFCFMPLSRNYLMVLGNETNDELIPLFYFFQRARFDPYLGERSQILTLTSILPHPINTYAENFKNRILKRVNEKDIRNLADLKAALEVPLDGFHVLEFEATAIPLILDADMLPAANADIQRRYGVTSLYAIHADSTAETGPAAAANAGEGI